jgi:hypothetical protein
MSAQLPALKREKLLVGLKIDSISMADVQSLLHWANNRQANQSDPSIPHPPRPVRGCPIRINKYFGSAECPL